MKKAKLDLKEFVKDETGKVAQGNMLISTAIAQRMLQSGSKDEAVIIKMVNWAMELGKEGYIEIDEGDVKTIKDWVVQNEELFVIIKAPTIKALDKLKFK